MKDYDLDKLHQCLLIIADEIDRICINNDIKYTLIGGSLIGAVRHNGFIPWDDDMDIGMRREDYNRFLDVCKRDLQSKFDLQTVDTDENYVYGFAKLMLKETTLMEFGRAKTKDRKGIFVDIFPFDCVPNNKKEQKRQKYVNYILMKMLRQKSKVMYLPSWSLKEKVIFRMIDIMNLFLSKKYLVKRLNDNMIMYNTTETDYICNLSGMYGYDKEMIPKSYLDRYCYRQFHNRIYMIIEDYHQYLGKIYGDYMQLPPENKRTTHGFQFIEFGPYA